MMMNTTLEQLRSLRLAGMATGLQEQLSQAGMTGLSFEERLALLVDREVHWRSDKRQARLLKAAHLKYPQACIEDTDSRAGRGLDRSAVMSLALGNWIESGHSVLITGLTARPGLLVPWPNMRAGVGTRRCISGCPGWVKSCAFVTATAALASG